LSYPIEIKPIPQNRLSGTAFFPAGDGIYKENKFIERANYPIMILGKDYDNELNFDIVRNTINQSEVDNINKTWKNLEKLFNSNILSECFFTNCIMGLRKGNSKNIGPSKAFLKINSDFLNENILLFKTQLDEVQPKLVIGLGIQVPLFIGKAFESDLPHLNKIRSFKQLDNSLYKQSITIKYKNKDLTFIFITHPSMYDANVWRRDGGKLFEEDLILKALHLALNI
jgi:hypothetical protein